jgi:hypothetical protein
MKNSCSALFRWRSRRWLEETKKTCHSRIDEDTIWMSASGFWEIRMKKVPEPPLRMIFWFEIVSYHLRIASFYPSHNETLWSNVQQHLDLHPVVSILAFHAVENSVKFLIGNHSRTTNLQQFPLEPLCFTITDRIARQDPSAVSLQNHDSESAVQSLLTDFRTYFQQIISNSAAFRSCDRCEGLNQWRNTASIQQRLSIPKISPPRNGVSLFSIVIAHSLSFTGDHPRKPM